LDVPSLHEGRGSVATVGSLLGGGLQLMVKITMTTSNNIFNFVMSFI
jgi:hypothetical protein